MRIGILTSGLVWVPGGSYRVMYEYANRLTRKGHEVHIVYPITFPSNLRDVRGIVHFLRSLLKSTDRATSWFPLDSRIVQHKVIWHANRSAHLPDCDVWLGMSPLPHIVRGLKSTGKPFAVFVQSPKEVIPAVNSESPLIAVSRFLFESLSSYEVERLFLVPNGIDPLVFCPKYPVENRAGTIGMMYVPKGIKDPHTGFEALRRVKQAKPDVKIILFGPTRRPPKAQFPITFYSRVPAEKVADVYNKCAIFMSSSKAEGFNLPVLEAMACGCAVVTTDSGGIRDFAEHKVNAIVVPPEDPQALADAVLYLLDNPNARWRLALNAVERARQMTWDTSVEQLERVLQEIV